MKNSLPQKNITKVVSYSPLEWKFLASSDSLRAAPSHLRRRPTQPRQTLHEPDYLNPSRHSVVRVDVNRSTSADLTVIEKSKKTCRMTMTDFKKLNTLSPLRCTPKSFRGRVAIPRKSISTFVHFFVHLYMYIHLPKNCHVHYTLYMILKIWSRYIHRSPMPINGKNVMKSKQIKSGTDIWKFLWFRLC